MGIEYVGHLIGNDLVCQEDRTLSRKVLVGQKDQILGSEDLVDQEDQTLGRE